MSKVTLQKLNFQLWLVVFLITLQVLGHTAPNWKALTCGKYVTRGLSYDSTLIICHDVLKSGNILHKRGFVDSQTVNIVKLVFLSCNVGIIRFQ